MDHQENRLALSRGSLVPQIPPTGCIAHQYADQDRMLLLEWLSDSYSVERQHINWLFRTPFLPHRMDKRNSAESHVTAVDCGDCSKAPPC